MKRISRRLIFVVPASILATGLFLYFLHFHHPLSTKVQDWGSFGTYINPFVTLANVSLFLIFSLLVYKYNNSINRPILIFKTESSSDTEIWQINNIGNGPALNLVVSYKVTKMGKWNSPSVKCYSLGKNEKVTLDWLTGSVDVIGVYYKDIFDDSYVAIVGNDITEVRNYSSFKSFDINGYNYNKTDFKELLNLTAIRITRARNLFFENIKSNSLTDTITQTTTTETTSSDG